MVSLNDYADVAYRNAKQKGFWDWHQSNNPDISERVGIAARLALVHSEVSEALEELRLPEFNRDLFAQELVDILIRVGDIARHFEIDLDKVMGEKLRYNSTRPRMHGKVL